MSCLTGPSLYRQEQRVFSVCRRPVRSTRPSSFRCSVYTGQTAVNFHHFIIWLDFGRISTCDECILRWSAPWWCRSINKQLNTIRRIDSVQWTNARFRRQRERCCRIRVRPDLSKCQQTVSKRLEMVQINHERQTKERAFWLTPSGCESVLLFGTLRPSLSVGWCSTGHFGRLRPVVLDALCRSPQFVRPAERLTSALSRWLAPKQNICVGDAF